MKHRTVLTVAAAALGLVPLAVITGPAPAAHAYSGTYQVSADGGQRNFVVPAFVRSIQIIAYGGAGEDGAAEDGPNAGGAGGRGARVIVTVPVVPGDVLHLAPGGAGDHSELGVRNFEGGLGGSGDQPGSRGGHGGSATTVSLDGELIVVAAGGGGGGGAGGSGNFVSATGGDGGEGTGTQGTRGTGNGYGAGGAGVVQGTGNGTAGNGGNATVGTLAGGGGGGGGGWWPGVAGGGGKGGDAGSWGAGAGGGGAGGVSWAKDPSATIEIAAKRFVGSVVLNWSPRPTVRVSASPNPASPGEPVNFTVDVGAAVTGAPIATGYVRLTLRNPDSPIVDLGRRLLTGGRVTFPVTSAFAVGQNTIWAEYEGDSYYEAATQFGFAETIVATPPKLTADGTLNFGDFVAATPVSLPLHVTNTGGSATGPLVFTPNDPALTVAPGDCPASGLAPNASCTALVTLRAPDGAFVGSVIEIADTRAALTGTTPVTVQVTGRASAPKIGFLDTLDFGSTSVGTPVDASTRGLNLSLVPWSAEIIALPAGTPFSFVSNGCAATVPVFGNCTMTLRFAPTAPGTFTTSLQIVDSTGQSRTTVTLTGTAVDPTPPPTTTTMPSTTTTRPSTTTTMPSTTTTRPSTTTTMPSTTTTRPSTTTTMPSTTTTRPSTTTTVTVPRPVVTRISPSSGPASGNTTVVITGRNLNGVTAVRFGSVAARSYTCPNPTRCIATSPPGVRHSTVDVQVVTAGGTSRSSGDDQFSYQR